VERAGWVVDLRNRVAFAAEHVVGSVNIGLDGSFTTYLGWTIPADAEITLLGETAAQIRGAQRELTRIGVESAAHAIGTVADWTGKRAPRGDSAPRPIKNTD
jgi:hydroxyacylglutathione hydrolase